MKIKHLINILKEEDPEIEVKIAINEDCDATYPIMKVQIDENNKKVTLIPDEFNGD